MYGETVTDALEVKQAGFGFGKRAVTHLSLFKRGEPCCSGKLSERERFSTVARACHRRRATTAGCAVPRNSAATAPHRRRRLGAVVLYVLVVLRLHADTRDVEARADHVPRGGTVVPCSRIRLDRVLKRTGGAVKIPQVAVPDPDGFLDRVCFVPRLGMGKTKCQSSRNLFV